MNPRQERGKIIAQHGQIKKRLYYWLVPSWSTNKYYIVKKGKDKVLTCNCEDYKLRQNACKHIYAVYQTAIIPQPQITIPKRKTYKQNWRAYNKAQKTEKQRFMEELHNLCKTFAKAEKKVGRPRSLDSDMVFISALKVYTNFSMNRANSDMDYARTQSFITKVVDKSTLSRFMQKPEFTSLLQNLITLSALPFAKYEKHFAVDSSGVGTTMKDQEDVTAYRQELAPKKFLKLHAMIGVDHHIATAVVITDKHTADTKPFPSLVLATAQNFEIEKVSADKGYFSMKNFEVVDKIGGTLFVPFKKQKIIPKESEIWKERHKNFFEEKDDFLANYHQRSNVESYFSLLKRRFNDFVRSKSLVAQVNEALLKVLCGNIIALIKKQAGVDVLLEDAYLEAK